VTWKEFKELVEAQGVTDDMKFAWIDISGFESEITVGKQDECFTIS